MMKQMLLFLSLAATLWGCAQTMPASWTSIPDVQTISRPAYTINADPQKGDNPYFVSFLLTIQNHSAQPLVVNWNDSRYLHIKKDLGLFVFKGIDPETIQSGIPTETIPAGGSFSKEIFPFRTIAFISRSMRPAATGLGFKPGILPGGDNTIQLALRLGENQLQESLTLHLKVVEQH